MMNEGVNITMHLPSDIVETLNVDTSLNVQYLKLTVERNIGIPSELQNIYHDDVLLSNDVIMGKKKNGVHISPFSTP